MQNSIIKISLTEFINYIRASGTPKATVVLNAKNKREKEYQSFEDYWLQLRQRIKKVHRNNLDKDELINLIYEMRKEKQENYTNAINGYCKFWGKKTIEWVEPLQAAWINGNIIISLNPELGLRFNNQIHYIKLYTSSDIKLDKKHADIILTLMANGLRNNNVSILDIKRGKLFEYQNKDTRIDDLINAEAVSFEHLWNSLN